MSSTTSDKRPRYSESQLQQYFKHIHLPESHRHSSISSLPNSSLLPFLHKLIQHQLVYVPFENLSLHYSQTHLNSIDPEDIFSKIVLGLSPTSSHAIPGNRRGGYCMENNTFLLTVLLSLGFNVWSAGGRVRGAAGYGGWSHMVIIVELPTELATETGVSGRVVSDRYAVDVGYGPNGAVQPVPLKSGVELVNIAPASARVVWRNVDCNSNPEQRLWVYEHRVAEDAEWEEQYCFTETEFHMADFKSMNYYSSTHNASWFTREIVCQRMIMPGAEGTNEEHEPHDGDSQIDGQMILGWGLKRRRAGATEHLVETFGTEQQRLDALKKYFNIEFTPQEQRGTESTAAAIAVRYKG